MKQNVIIYYVIPDITQRKARLLDLFRLVIKCQFDRFLKAVQGEKVRPIGGIKVMMQHCLLLKELGYDAELLRLGSYEGNFFGYDIQSKTIPEVQNDGYTNHIFVLPEIMPNLDLGKVSSKKVMFVQNWVHLYDNNSFPHQAIHGSYIENGFDMVMCCSEYLTTKLIAEDIKQSRVVNNFIDLDKFVAAPESRVTGRVLALPRKKKADLDKIMSLVQGHDIEFKLVDGVTQEQLIKEYQQADVFLATGYPEGFGLPPLEAMACGAVVVGFSGGGGLAYMKHENTALIADDGDCEEAASLLLRVLGDNQLKESLRASGQKIAQQYSKEKTKTEISEFYQQLTN